MSQPTFPFRHYNGDGVADIAVYRAGMWYVKDLFSFAYGGVPGDLPIPGDYDADGDADVAVYRSGIWYIKDQATVSYGGVPGDYPLPAPDTNGGGDPYQ